MLCSAKKTEPNFCAHRGLRDASPSVVKRARRGKPTSQETPYFQPLSAPTFPQQKTLTSIRPLHYLGAHHARALQSLCMTLTIALRGASLAQLWLRPSNAYLPSLRPPMPTAPVERLEEPFTCAVVTDHPHLLQLRLLLRSRLTMSHSTFSPKCRTIHQSLTRTRMSPTLSQNLKICRSTPRPKRTLRPRPGVGAVSVVLFKPTMTMSSSKMPRDAAMVNCQIILHTSLPILRGVRSFTPSAQ